MGRKTAPQVVAPLGLKVEYVATGELMPMPGNPRRNEKAIPKVAESIKRFGWTNPVLARRADRVVVAGHTRLEAAKRLGLDKVPVIWLDLDPVSSRLYNLADNRLGEVAEWDDEALATMLKDLSHEDAAGLTIAGFDQEELLKAVGDLKGPEMGTGEAPPGSYQVLVECRDELQQEELISRFETEGLTCRPLIF